MSINIKQIGIILLAAVFLLIVGMGIHSLQDETPKEWLELNVDNYITTVGNGVYYFSHTDKIFALRLAKFKADKNCNIIAITPNIANGNTSGYFVVCEDK